MGDTRGECCRSLCENPTFALHDVNSHDEGGNYTAGRLALLKASPLTRFFHPPTSHPQPRTYSLPSFSAEMRATADEMREAKLPLDYRDYCANLLIPLNKCRRQTLYAPWKCEHERHEYEKCQYEEYRRRVQLKGQQS